MHTEMGIKCQGGWIAVSRKQWVTLSTIAPCLLMSSRHQTKGKIVLEMSEQDNCKIAPRRLKSNTNSHFHFSRSSVFLEPLISKMSELSIYWFQTKLPTPTQRQNYPQTFYKTTHGTPTLPLQNTVQTPCKIICSEGKTTHAPLNSLPQTALSTWEELKGNWKLLEIDNEQFYWK